MTNQFILLQESLSLVPTPKGLSTALQHHKKALEV